MELKDFIKVYDNTIPPKIISSLIKYLNDKGEFYNAGIVGTDATKNQVHKDVRDTESHDFGNKGTMTDTHWTAFLNNVFRQVAQKYEKDLNSLTGVSPQRIINVTALKYGVGGHYVPHVDHGHDVPRTLSIIYFLNNDYEGGDLRFHNPNQQSEVYKTVTSAPGRVIIWPSNFLYPHSVTPVTKGKRYVIVSWLL